MEKKKVERKGKTCEIGGWEMRERGLEVEESTFRRTQT